MANKTIIETLKTKLRGELLQPSDNNYEEARRVYNGMIDKRPQLIARCSDVADVFTSVNFARENGLLLAIRGGGHNIGGLGICDGGLVIDLSLLKSTRIDPKTRTVRVGGGCTWGDVDHATHPFGLAVPAGVISTTGVGGLTLGGGSGYLTRKYGLTIDNLLSADMVLADGTFVTVSADENEDLFWAIRGGGGNFGVVTSFLFRAHPIHTVYAGVTLWEIGKTQEVMKWYRAFTSDASNDLYGFFALLTVPGDPFPEPLHGKKMCGVVWCYTGPPEEAENVFRPIHEFGPPSFAHVGEMPFPALQSMFDVFYPPGMQWYFRGDFINELSDDAINQHLKYGLELPTPHSVMHLYPIDGAAHQVDKTETPWAYRDSRWSQVIIGVDPDAEKKELITSWTKNYYNAVHPYSAGGAYVNFMMDEGETRIKASYKDNYKRLVEIKSKYDPDNLFRVNQNIPPAG